MKNLVRNLILIMVVSLVSISAPAAISQTPQTDVHTTGTVKVHRFKQDGYRRRYRLYSPANLKPSDGPRPLVLALHGGGGTDRSMIKLDKERWKTLADEHGFYVAYPQAVDKLWNFGEGQISETLDPDVDDLAYFRRVINYVSVRKNIDPNRIFATGISRGGQASYFLACHMPNRIRAVTPVAMSLPEFMVDDCQEGPPIGIAIINGTADPQVPYDGGSIVVFRKKRGIVLSTEKTIALWRNRNGCSARPSTVSHIDPIGDKTSIDMKEWSQCSGAPVKLFQVNNGGHTWPSGLQYLPSRIVGETSQDINASDEAWAFFSQFK